MKIVYIHHSCFLITTPRCMVLIDYYQDAPKGDNTFWVGDEVLSSNLPLYILCTHSHADHFNREILQWKKKHPAITYIFEQELKTHIDTTAFPDIVFLTKEQTYQDDLVRVTAFGSTDEGGSFLIDVDGKRLFHAGDLNNWHWAEEVSAEEAITFENRYLCELELLAEHTQSVDVAMFPVDARLGKEYMKGAQQFVERIACRYFIPMHAQDRFDKANAFASIAQRNNAQFLAVNQRGDSWTIE